MDSGQPLRGFRNDRERFRQKCTPGQSPGVAIIRRSAAIDLPIRSGGLLVLLVVVVLGEFAVDDIVLGRTGLRTGIAAGRAGAGLILLRLRVHRLTELHRGLRERIGLGRDLLGVVALDGFLCGGERILDRAALGLADLGAVLGERLLGRVDQRLGVVLRLDLGFPLLVLLGVRLGVLHHLLDVVVRKAARGLDADLLLLAGAFVFRRHV